MAKKRLDFGNAFVKYSENLQWKVVETHAKIILHTVDCNQYGYFFDDEPSKPIQYPCMLGYKFWSNGMTTNYLNGMAHDCKFYMPTTDYDVNYFWEQRQEETGEGDVAEIYQTIKKNIELHWNFLRHFAKNIVNHNNECKRFKFKHGKFGCLENFTSWDDNITMQYYEEKPECDYLKKPFM